MAPRTVYADVPSTLLGVGRDISCWGDSLSQDTFETELATLSGVTVRSRGVGSQNSTHIAGRLGALVRNLTVSSDTISSGANTVTHIDGVAVTGMSTAGAQSEQFLSSLGDNTTRSVTGTLGSVHGTLQRASSGGPPSTSETYTFTPDGGQVLPANCPAQTPFIVDQTYATDTHVYWAGRNDYSSSDLVATNSTKMASWLPHKRYVVMSILNGDLVNERLGESAYPDILACEQKLALAHPANFLNIRRLLIDRGLSDAGITPTAQDLLDIADDIPPDSLRGDTLHLNTAGYDLVALYLYQFMVAKGWL